MEHMGLPELVLKSPLSGSNLKTINQRQQETEMQLKIFCSYILLLLVFSQASLPLPSVPGCIL
jgi:hypothetical protein